MRKINYGKYEQILEMKHNHTPESKIIADLKCSYSTIRQALEWEHQGKIKPTTVSTTPISSSKSSEEKADLFVQGSTQLLSLFMDLSQEENITPEKWNAKIQKHLDFPLMDKLKEAVHL